MATTSKPWRGSPTPLRKGWKPPTAAERRKEWEAFLASTADLPPVDDSFLDDDEPEVPPCLT
jgi:hypothetical protein